jgi:hypothetical protein
MKTVLIEQEKIFTSYSLDKIVISRIFRELKKKNHTSNNPINKWLNELNRYFSKNEVQDHVWWLRPIIPVIWEAEIWRIVVRGHLGQKVSETPISTNKLGMVVYACNPRYMGSIGGRITI